MVRVRNSSAAALHRIQMRRLRHEWETKAAHDRRANRDVQDEAIQELFGIGLAMQITKREVAPQQAARMGGHINQLQGLITGFRAAIADVRAEPVNVPQWRTAPCGKWPSISVPTNLGRPPRGCPGPSKAGALDRRRLGCVVRTRRPREVPASSPARPGFRPYYDGKRGWPKHLSR